MSQNTVKLFKTLISESSKIPDFKFRNYFIRRITDTFYSGQELRPEEEILGCQDLPLIGSVEAATRPF